jgi:hypothetical protein
MRSLAALALAAAVPVLLPLAGCDRSGRNVDRVPESAGVRPPPAAFDWEHPERALGMDAEGTAARLGSFDWWGDVAWSTTRGERRVAATERSRVRQTADGAFLAQSDVDPGLGPGSETGMRVAWVGQKTYARNRYAPSGAWRERPSDHGRDARRFRDQAFGAAGDLAVLLGPALQVVPQGDATALGRPARRFSLRLDRARFTPGPSRLGPGAPRIEGPLGEDTALRLAFLDGREPLDATGELVADAATGAPLEIRMRALFGVKGDPDARVEVRLEGRMTALGGSVAAVVAPEPALPDERKPRGVARALEQAGFGKKKEKSDAAEPGPSDEEE